MGALTDRGARDDLDPGGPGGAGLADGGGSGRRTGDFLGGWGLGLAVVPIAGVVGAVLGVIAGWIAFAVLVVSAATLPPLNSRRAAGVVAGVLTVAGVGFTLLMGMLATMGDW